MVHVDVSVSAFLEKTVGVLDNFSNTSNKGTGE